MLKFSESAGGIIGSKPISYNMNVHRRYYFIISVRESVNQRMLWHIIFWKASAPASWWLRWVLSVSECTTCRLGTEHYEVGINSVSLWYFYKFPYIQHTAMMDTNRKFVATICAGIYLVTLQKYVATGEFFINRMSGIFTHSECSHWMSCIWRTILVFFHSICPFVVFRTKSLQFIHRSRRFCRIITLCDSSAKEGSHRTCLIKARLKRYNRWHQTSTKEE